jgi:hypothetical protein
VWQCTSTAQLPSRQAWLRHLPLLLNRAPRTLHWNVLGLCASPSEPRLFSAFLPAPQRPQTAGALERLPLRAAPALRIPSRPAARAGLPRPQRITETKRMQSFLYDVENRIFGSYVPA